MTNLAQTAWFGPVMMVVFLLQLAALVYVIIQYIRGCRAESKQIDQLGRERDYLFGSVNHMARMVYLMGKYVDVEWIQNELNSIIEKIKSGELK